MKRTVLIGVACKSDGHKRITQGQNFAVVGGNEETHAALTESCIKINEKLARKGKTLDTADPREVDDAAQAAGYRRAL